MNPIIPQEINKQAEGNAKEWIALQGELNKKEHLSELSKALDEGYYKIPPRIETKIPPQDNWDELSKELNKDCFKMPPNKETEISQNNWGRLQEVLQDKDYRIPEFDGKYYFHDGRTDTLTEEIKRQFPKINEAQINKLKGDIAENLMDAYFLKNGWKKLDGEVGRNGIDGLYVKFDKEGNITK